MQLRKVVRSKMFPHLIATLQWVLLILILAFNLNFSVIVTGGVADGGLKVLMLFNLWMLVFPIVLCLIFYRTRKEGEAERFIVYLSMITIAFSVVNVSLYFVNGFLVLMKATEVIAWSLYNGLVSLSIYKIWTMFLLPVLRRSVRLEKKTLRTEQNYGRVD